MHRIISISTCPGSDLKTYYICALLLEKLKKSASSPNIPFECDVSGEVLSKSQISGYWKEGDTTDEKAGILMLGAVHVAATDEDSQPYKTDISSVMNTPDRSPANLDITDSFQDMNLSTGYCENCCNNQSTPELNIRDRIYRHPPPYQDRVQQEKRAMKASLDKYRHPPPYRETAQLHDDINSLYSGRISPAERTEIINKLMSFQESGCVTQYYQSQPCLQTTCKGIKVDKETMTDVCPDNNLDSFTTNMPVCRNGNYVGLYDSHATIMSDPYAYTCTHGIPFQDDISSVPTNVYSNSGNASLVCSSQQVYSSCVYSDPNDQTFQTPAYHG